MKILRERVVGLVAEVIHRSDLLGFFFDYRDVRVVGA